MDFLFILLAIIGGACALTAMCIYAFRVYYRIRNKKAYTQFFTELEPETAVVYVDNQGRKWRAFVNPLTIPAIRAISAEMAVNMLKLNFTKDALVEFLNQLTLAIEDQDYTKMGYLVYQAKERVQFACEENSLLELAKIYFLLEDEDPRTMHNSIQSLKTQIWQDDEDCKSFFLRGVWKFIELSSTLSESNLIEYLKAQKIKNAMRDLTPSKICDLFMEQVNLHNYIVSKEDIITMDAIIIKSVEEYYSIINTFLLHADLKEEISEKIRNGRN